MRTRRRASPSAFPVVATEFRVRYAETDAMGIAHHTAYLVWFEAGRTEYTRAMGMPYREVERDGMRLVVVEAHCRYHRPARYDDIVLVHTTVHEVSKAKVIFAYEVRLQESGALLAEGQTAHAATDPQGRVRRIPEHVQQALAGGGRNGGEKGEIL